MRQTIYARNGAVTAGHPLAAQAGLRLLLAGGNAVDAAVATAAALSVVMPDMIGPFGYGFALVAPPGVDRPVVVDMNGTAPRAATPEAVGAALAGPTPGVRGRTGPLVRGPRAPLVPGVVRGWETMLRRWGTRSLADVLQPAIEYAEEGRPLDAEGAMHIARHVAEIGHVASWARVFLVEGAPPRPGHLLRMPALARTFRRLAAGGADVLYTGDLAKEVARFFAAEGGWITAEDLAAYRVQEKAPVTMPYRDLVVHGAPPPSSAMTWMQALRTLEGYDLGALGHNTARYLHVVVEATRAAYLDTYRHNGDPGHVGVPVDRLLGADHAARTRAAIGERAGTVTPAGRPGPAGTRPVGSTTHLNVVDRHGTVVSMTNTLGAFFGAGLVIGDTGMLANDGMDWFEAERSPWTGEPSPAAVAAGKRPRLSLSPGMIYRAGTPWMAVGGAGAETTMAGILQPILNVVEFGMEPQRANDAPRFRWGDLMYYTLGTRLRLEAAIGPEVRADLAARGHDLVPLDEEPQPLVGNTNMILYDAGSGTMQTGVNSRGRDAAAAY
jgi:gamma-glutamyltranspeptidase/glutathione hydrolase